MQEILPVEEKDAGNNGTDQPGQAGGEGGPLQVPAETGYKKAIQQNVGRRVGKGSGQAESRTPCGDHQGMKGPGQHLEGHEKRQHPPVGHAVPHQRIGSAHPAGNGRHQEKEGNRQQYACCGQRRHRHTQDTAGPFPPALSQFLGDQGAGPGAEHQSHIHNDQQGGKDQVLRLKGRLADVVGYKKTVRHLISVVHKLHPDTGQGKQHDRGHFEVLR